jgi:hypothetical protein
MNKRHAIYFGYLLESLGVGIYSVKSWSVNMSPFWKYILFSSLIASPRREAARLLLPAVGLQWILTGDIDHQKFKLDDRTNQQLSSSASDLIINPCI